MSNPSYISNPQAIYDSSFAIIKSEADLSAFDAQEAEIATRLVHACGMIDLVDDLVFSKGAAISGNAALTASAPILCDVNMAAAGITRKFIQKGNRVLCGLDHKATQPLATRKGLTRSAAGLELLADQFENAIVAIGNAPTALFRLLELVEMGAAKPALVLGFPVGFVGAVESKDALIANTLDIPFIALKGRRGGSAMAAAAVNALLLQQNGAK